MSADPAAYADYENILKRKVMTKEDKTVLNGYVAGREYIQMYITEYEYELEDAAKNFSLDDYSFAYKNAGKKVRNKV